MNPVIRKPPKLYCAAEVETVLAEIAPAAVLIMPKVDGHAAVYERGRLRTRNADVSGRLPDLTLPEIPAGVQVLGELVCGRFVAYGARGLPGTVLEHVKHLKRRGFYTPYVYRLNGLAMPSIRDAVTGICQWADWEGLPTDGRVITCATTGQRWAVKLLLDHNPIAPVLSPFGEKLELPDASY